MNILRKRAQKVKKHNNFTFQATFHNVALETETSFKLQRCLSLLRKLEKSMINVKT